MAYQSGTTTLVTGTETTLGNVNSVGEFLLVVDLVNLAAGDVTEIRSYQTVLSSGTSRVANYVMYAGAQPTDAMLYISNRYVNDLIEKDSVKFTLKQTFGTGRAYPWKIVQVGPPNFHLLSVSAAGAVTVGTNNDKTGYGLNTGTFLLAIADAVWDDQNSDHLITGSTGKALSNASSAGDPWSTNIPGAYIAGQAGFIVGTNIDVRTSSRMASGTVTVGVNNDKTGYLLSGTSTDPWLTALPGAYGAGTAGKILGTNLDVLVSSRMASGTVVVATNNDKTGYSLSSPQNFNLIGNISGTHVGNIQGSVGSVTGSVGSVVGLTPSLLDVAVSSRMASGTVVVGTNNDKTGYSLSSPQTFNLIGNISGTWVGNQTGTFLGNLIGNISGSVGALQVNNDKTGYSLLNNQVINFSGTITTVVNVTNPVTVGTNNDKTGYSLSSPQSFNLIGNISGTHVGNQIGNIQGSVANVTGSVGGVTGLTPSLLDVAVSSRMASGTVVVATVNDKTGYSLSSPQSFNLIGNISGTHVGNQIGNIQGSVANVTGSVGGVVGLTPSLLDVAVSSRMASGTVTVGTNNDKTGYGLSTGTFIQAIVNQVWDEQNGLHLITGSTGKSLSNASSAGDPWSTAIPGSYGAGTAGFIVGNNLDARISSRLASGTVVAATVNDKTGYSLSSPQSFNLIGNISGTHVGNQVGNIQGSVANVTGSVGGVTGLTPSLLDVAVSSRMASGTVTVGTNNDKTGYGLSTGTLLSAIADAVWDEQIGGHLVTGSTGKSLSSASSAGDPWTTPIPGAYGAGTAGYIIGTNVDTPISSRLSSGTFASNYVVPPTAAANATAVLSAATANPIDANVQEVNDVTIIGNGSTTPWGP